MTLDLLVLHPRTFVDVALLSIARNDFGKHGRAWDDVQATNKTKLAQQILHTFCKNLIWGEILRIQIKPGFTNKFSTLKKKWFWVAASTEHTLPNKDV